MADKTRPETEAWTNGDDQIQVHDDDLESGDSEKLCALSKGCFWALLSQFVDKLHHKITENEEPIHVLTDMECNIPR